MALSAPHEPEMATGPPPPLLLTKRVTTFLVANLSDQITTLLLLTPDGKLLAYASNPSIPVATLRTHGTVAASLYAIHSSGTDRDTVDAALGGAAAAQRQSSSRREGAARTTRGGGGAPSTPLAVTIQLETGVVLVIRRLRCGMLFVCMGSLAANTNTNNPSQNQQQQPAAVHPPNGNSNHHSPPTSPQPQPPPSHALGSPSEAASVLSAATGHTAASSVMFGAGTEGVLATRRQVEELARWLDDKLGALEVPGDGLGGGMV